MDSLRFLDEDSFRAINGLVLVRLPNYRLWRYGDRVGVQGSLETPTEDGQFSYRDYLARKRIYTLMSNPQVELLMHGRGNWLLYGLYALREHAKSTLYELFPDPEASLLIGILLGVETGIPESVNKAFQDSGTSHIVAISGFKWRAALAAPDGNLHLIVLDVNVNSQSGEALLIQTPTGRYVLINGGPSASALSDGLGRRLPPGQKELDFLVIAGAEEEQLAGLSRNLERYPPRQVLWTGPTGATRAARQVQEGLAGRSIPVVTAQSGGSLDLGEGAVLKVLSANERGAVLLLEWGNFRALLPLGVDATTLDSLTSDRSLPPISALFLAGSGYAPLNPPELIRNLQPQLILLSVAPGDRRNRPDPETLQAIQDFPLLRTDHNGWIDVTSDGKQAWVQVDQVRE